MNTQSTSTLNGKKVIVLGGSAGIGLATAKAAAAEGANVIIVSSNQQRIDKALAELPAGSNGYAIDLGKEENISSFFESVGNFDHLAFTAGENISLNMIAETEIAKAQAFLNLRFWSMFAAVKHGAKHINPGGSINLTGGIAGRRSPKGWAVAAALCCALEGFVRAAAVELAPVRVNSAVPGVIKTNLWDSMATTDRDALYQSVANSIPVQRTGEADDVALTFVYLMKQQFGTGQNIVVDGGTVLV